MSKKNRPLWTLLDKRREINKNVKTFSNIPTNTQTDESGLSSLLSILPSAADVNPMDEQQPLKPKKKKKRRPRLS